MRWQRSSTAGEPPADPVGDAVAEALTDLVGGATVELNYSPEGADGHHEASDEGVAVATGEGPPGWDLSIAVRLHDRVKALTDPDASERGGLGELLGRLPAAGLRASSRLRPGVGWQQEHAMPSLRRALRDMVATELLNDYLDTRVGAGPHVDLVADTIDYLIELSGTRVEAHDLTHGVVVADVFHDDPRLSFRYPLDVRTAKRAPLLFDGRRSVLLVDPEGRARTELQRHRLAALAPGVDLTRTDVVGSMSNGSLVADATRIVGGVGFFVRADRTIWTFVEGLPLLVRRGEHWTAFPLELESLLGKLLGGGAAASIVV